MSLPLFLQGLGSIGVFASRAFLPAFVTALLLRFGPHAPVLAGFGLLPRVRDVPTWFTSDAAVAVLGVLALLELVAERVPDAKVFLDEVHDYLKTAIGVLTYLGVLNATDRAAVRGVIDQAGWLDALPVVVVGAGVYLASKARGAVVGTLGDADEDDDLGLQGLLRWVEDVWGGLGPVALIVFPLLTIAAFGLAAAVLWGVERRFSSRGEKEKVACAGCGRPIHAGALACPSCRAPVKGPQGVGLLGRANGRPADVASQPYRLVAVKRCPVCATRLTGRAVKIACGACGHRVVSDADFARKYLAFVDRRVPVVCVVCFLFGLVPVLGVIPGVIYYRLSIVAPFRRYIPRGRGFLVRWGVRGTVLLLVAFQWVPVAGALAVPLMAVIHYLAYRRAYATLALTP